MSTRLDAVDPHAVLQVRRDCEPEVLDAAFRVLSRRFGPGGCEADPALHDAVQRAYVQLLSPERLAALPPQPAPVAPTAPAEAATCPGTSGTLAFGRYQGWRIVDLAREDPEYLRWLSRQAVGQRFVEEINRLLPPSPAPGWPSPDSARECAHRP